MQAASILENMHVRERYSFSGISDTAKYAFN